MDLIAHIHSSLGDNVEFWSKTAWLVFMLADLPRLLFRVGLSLSNVFSRKHRKQKHSRIRIVFQSVLPNIGYMASLLILYAVFDAWIFLILFFVYCLPLGVRTVHQVGKGNAYVTDAKGHNLNDIVIKPLRMLALLIAAWTCNQPIWLVGFGIVFAKWVLTIPHDRIFDVPSLYHGSIVMLSAILVLLIFPYDFGVIKSDTLNLFLSTTASVYATFVGLVAVFFTIILGDNRNEPAFRRYFTRGMIISFTSTSILITLCLLGLLLFGTEPLSLASTDLFQRTTSFSWTKYLVFGLVYALGSLGFLSTILTGYLMLLHTGGLAPDVWRVSNRAPRPDNSTQAVAQNTIPPTPRR